MPFSQSIAGLSLVPIQQLLFPFAQNPENPFVFSFSHLPGVTITLTFFCVVLDTELLLAR